MDIGQFENWVIEKINELKDRDYSPSRDFYWEILEEVNKFKEEIRGE